MNEDDGSFYVNHRLLLRGIAPYPTPVKTAPSHARRTGYSQVTCPLKKFPFDREIGHIRLPRSAIIS
jgi:hypothetical protein